MRRPLGAIATIIIITFLFSLSSLPAAAVTTTLYPAGDATVRSDDPARNFTYEILQLWRDPTSNLRTWAYIQFDLSSIPADSRIDSGVLFLYVQQAWPSIDFPVSGYRCAEGWGESSITYANRPDSNTEPAAESLFAPIMGTYQKIELTGLIQGWVNGEYPNHGIKVGSPRFSEPAARFQWYFNGRETDTPPYLVVTYAAPATSSVETGTSSSSTTGTSAGSIEPIPVSSEPAAGSQITKVKADRIKMSSAYITWTTDVDSNSYVEYGEKTDYGKTSGKDDRTKTHSVQLIELKPDTNYHFRVKSTNADGHQVVSRDYTFKTAKKEEAVEKKKAEEKNKIWPWITIGVLGLVVLVLAGILIFLYLRNRRRR